MIHFIHSFPSDDLIPFVCQRESCPNAGNAEATKVCYDHNISITYAPDSPPPLYLCIECANEIHRENPNQIFGDILHSMAQVSMICENKVCPSVIKCCFSHFIQNFMLFFIRIVVQPTNQPFQYVSQRNVPATMEIIRFDTVLSVTAIDITVGEAAIILCTRVFHRLGKWNLKCKHTWLKLL